MSSAVGRKSNVKELMKSHTGVDQICGPESEMSTAEFILRGAGRGTGENC